VSDAGKLEAMSSEGLGALYGRYADWLRGRLRRSVGADEAADVVQETYIRVAPLAAAGIRHPKALLLRIAMNLVRDEARRRGRVEAHAPFGMDLAPADQVDQLALKQIILAMPPLYRDVFVLKRFGGMTYPEIARLKGVSVQTVRWRMSRAMEHCLTQLDG
jgi:RNA polymerase sigma-70 factor (ECF subfamily)